jgi:bacteriocin biosynthesis cyclodehydratase domain-containing protein
LSSNASNYPRLKDGVIVQRCESGRWQLRSGFDGLSYLEGTAVDSLLPLLLPALQGSQGIAPVLAQLSASQKKDANELLVTLDELQLLAKLGGEASHLARSMEASAALTENALTRFRDIIPYVIGRGPLADSIENSLVAAGFASSVRSDISDRSEPFPGSGIPIVCITDFAEDQVVRFNASMLHDQQPWMIAGAWNRRLMIGPLMRPGITACFECVTKRFDSNRQHPEAWNEFQRSAESTFCLAPGEPVLPSYLQLAAGLVAAELTAFAMGEKCNIDGRVLIYYPLEAKTELENVLVLPWCPACSPPA